MLEYFCYISESKVNQLIQQIDEANTDTITEEKLAEKQRKINPSLGKILSLFSLGVTFGKSDRIIVSSVKHETVIHKLRRVLLFIGNNYQIINIAKVIRENKNIDSIYYSYSGTFKVVSNDNTFAIVESAITKQIKLQLVCSLKYFSDMGMEGESYVPHSGNMMFFNGLIKLNFETLIVVQGVKKDKILASPIYLALKPVKGVNI